MMKKFWMFCLLMIVVLSVSHAFAYEDATKYISIYDQAKGTYYGEIKNSYGQDRFGKSFWDKELIKKIGKTINADGLKAPYISNDGCCLLAYLHLVQYLTYKANGETAQVDLLAEWAPLHDVPSEAEGTYDKYLLRKSGINTSSVTKDSFSSWKTFFDNGGAALIAISNSAGGHYFIVVGYAEQNGKQYLQAVDSMRGATSKRLNGHTTYDFSTFSPYYTDLGQGPGGQYWILFDDFNKSKVSVAKKYQSNMRKGAAAYFERCKNRTKAEITVR